MESKNIFFLTSKLVEVNVQQFISILETHYIDKLHGNQL